MSGPLHVPQKPCGLAKAPHLSVPCSVICRTIYCTRSLQELAPFPLRTQTSIQVRMPTLYYHRASMNSSYRISCCLSFRGHRLWYLNYCLHWQEAIISAESGRIHRSTNNKKKKPHLLKNLLSHKSNPFPNYGIYILQGPIVSLPDCTKLFSQCFFVKEEEEEEKKRPGRARETTRGNLVSV